MQWLGLLKSKQTRVNDVLFEEPEFHATLKGFIQGQIEKHEI